MDERGSQWSRAPMASLDCMEDVQTTPHQDTPPCLTITKDKEKEDTLSPGIPTLVHSFSRQSTPTPGLRYRNLGKSGLRVSNIGLGTWVTFSSQVSEDQAEEIVNMAYESGVNVFDLSDAYCGPRAELQLGRILKQRGWRRSSYVVVTKVYWSYKGEERGLSRKHIIESIKNSLERLQLSYVDLVLIHRADPMCPMEEVVRTMQHALSQGWIMYWGTSRWSSVEISEAYNNCRQFNCITPICEQSEYHFLCRDKVELSLPETYNKIGVGLMAWSPLTMGFMMGKLEDGVPGFTRASFRHKYSSLSWTEDDSGSTKENPPWNANAGRSCPEDTRRHASKMRDISALADRLHCTPAQLAIAWGLKNDQVHCLLVGATCIEQLYENLQALQLVPKLTTAVLLEIERVLENKPVRPPMVSTLALR